MPIFTTTDSNLQPPPPPCWVTLFRHRRQVIFTAPTAVATISIGDSLLAVMRTLLIPEIPSPAAGSSPSGPAILPFVPRVLNSPFGPIHVTPGPSSLVESVMGGVPTDVARELADREDTFDGYDEDGNPISPPTSGNNRSGASSSSRSKEMGSTQHSTSTRTSRQQSSHIGHQLRKAAAHKAPTEHMPITVSIPNLNIELYFDAPCEALCPYTKLPYPTGPVQLLAVVMQNSTRALNLLFSNERSIATARPQSNVMAGLPPPPPPTTGNSPALRPQGGKPIDLSSAKPSVASSSPPAIRRALSMTSAISAAGPSRRGRLLPPTVAQHSQQNLPHGSGSAVTPMYAPEDGTFQWYQIAFQCVAPRPSDEETGSQKKNGTHLSFYFKIPAQHRDRFVPERPDHPTMYIDNKGRAVPFVASLAVLADEPFTASYRYRNLHSVPDHVVASRLLSLLCPERSANFVCTGEELVTSPPTSGPSSSLATYNSAPANTITSNSMLLIPGFGAIFVPSGAFLAIDFTSPQLAGALLGQPQSILYELPDLVVQGDVRKGEVSVGSSRREVQPTEGAKYEGYDEWDAADDSTNIARAVTSKNFFKRNTGFHTAASTPGYVYTYPKLGIDLHFSPTANTLRFITVRNPNASVRNIRDAALRYQQPAYCMWLSPLTIPPPQGEDEEGKPTTSGDQSKSSSPKAGSSVAHPTLMHPWKKWAATEAGLTNNGRLRGILAPSIAQYQEKRLKCLLKVVSLGGAVVCADALAGSSIANPQALPSSHRSSKSSRASPNNASHIPPTWSEYLATGDNVTSAFIFRNVTGSCTIGDKVRSIVLSWGGSLPSSGYLTSAAKAKVASYLWTQTPEGGYGTSEASGHLSSPFEVEEMEPASTWSHEMVQSAPLTPPPTATQADEEEDFFSAPRTSTRKEDLPHRSPADLTGTAAIEKPTIDSPFDPYTMAQSDSDTFHPSGRAQPPTAPTSGLSTAPSSAVSRHSPGGFASSSNHPTSHLVSDIIEVLKPKHNNSTTDADASDSQSHTVAPPNVEFYDPLSPVGLAGKEGEGYRYQHIDPYPSKTEQPPTSASARSGMPPPSLFGTPPLAPPPTLLQTINTTNSPRRTTAPSVARVGSMQSWDSMDASNVGDSTAVAAAAPVPPRTQAANEDDEDAKSEETYEDDFVDDVYHSCDGSGNCGEVPSLFYSEKFLRESTAAAKEDEDYVFAQPPTTSKRFRKAETESAVAFSSAQLATEAQSAEDATAEDIEDEVELPSSQVDPPSLEDQQPSNSDFIGAAATSTASMVKTATTPTNTYRSSSPREKHTSAEASPSPSATDEFWHRTGTDNTGPQSTNVAVTSDVGSWFLGGGTMEGANTNPFGTEGNQISGQGSDDDADEDGMSASMRRALEVQMYTPFSVMSPSRPPTPSVPAPAESETMVSSASPETEIEPDEPLVQVQPAAASSKSSAKTKKGKKNKKGSVATTSASPSTPEKLKGSKVAHDEDGDDTPSAQPVSTPEPESGGEQFDWNEPRRNVAATAKWVQRLPPPTAGSSTVSSAFQTPEVSPFQPPTAPPKATVKAPKPINYSEPNSTPDAPTVQGDDGVEDFMLPPSNQPEPKPNPLLEPPTSSGSAPRSGDSYFDPPLTKTQKKKNAKLVKALQIEAGEGAKAEGADDDVDGQDKGNAGDDSLPTSIIKGLRSGAGRQATDDSSQSQEQVHAKGGNRPFYTPCTSSHPATPEISCQLTGSLSRQGTNTPPHGTVTAVGSPSNVKVSGSPNAETEDDADGKDWGEADTPETVSPATTSPSTTPPLKPKNPSGSASASSKGKGKKKKGRK